MPNMAKERQLTFGNVGHMLNRRQAISPDGKWAAYDTRNDDTHIARTDSVEMVHLDSQRIVSLYRTQTSSLYGPGVGAVAFHPAEHRVVFIHGLESCSHETPYSGARRFGAIVRTDAPGSWIHAEARIQHTREGNRPRIDGVLSGGTHAHSWSHDGWLSFTYNDAWLEQRSRIDHSVRDIRTVGFMKPGAVALDRTDSESFSGSMQAFIAARVSGRSENGSNEIEQATEECWIGRNGYMDANGIRRPKALAFQGTVRSDRGETVHEIFVCDLPVENASKEFAESSAMVRPSELLEPAKGCVQQRLTYTADRKYPGIQGPRNWLVASDDGDTLYAPMRDNHGIVQLHRISTHGGNIEQISDWEHSLGGQISLDPKGTLCAAICDHRICLTDLASGQSKWLTDRSENPPTGAVHFAGDRIVYNRFIGNKHSGVMQVFACEMH